MATREEILALIETARTRAATEVLSWIPEKKGDRIAGEVVELGTITTKFGIYNTTTIRPIGDCVENGETKEYAENALVRVAWMGAVLVAQYLRMRPTPRNIVAFHYQDDIAPQNGMNDYALIVAVVIDHTTGDSKIPVEIAVPVPTRAQLEQMAPSGVVPETGEVRPVTPGINPLTPREGEEPLAATAEEMAAAEAKRASRGK